MSTIIRQAASIRLALTLALGALLIGCGVRTTSGPATAQPATPTTAPQPTAAVLTTAPTFVPTARVDAPTTEPALAPTVEPTAAPSSEGLLPAPLYFITNSPTEPSQIVRLERDGKTRTALLNEAPSKEILTILEFDVSPVDGSLAYIIQGQNGNSLIKTGPDGQGRTVLLANASVNTPRWSPDGKTIAVGVFQAPESTGGMIGGVYLVPANGGAPKLLQANDPIADPANPSPEARGFAPKTWSPDGKRLLMGMFSQVVEGGGLAVKDLATGALVDIDAPQGLDPAEPIAWSPDSRAIYSGMSRPGYLIPVPGLWRADATTGKTTSYIAGEPKPGQFTLVRAVHPMNDGSVYALLATTTKLPDIGEDPNAVWPQFVLMHVSGERAASQRIGEATYENPGDSVTWAGDGSGMLIDQFDAKTGASTTIWLPTDGGPRMTIAESISAGSVRWGPKG